MITKCGICGKEFQHSKNKLCSKICRGKHISNITKGREVSQKTREKLRISSTGRPKSPETIAKVCKTMTGRKLSRVWIENVSKALRHDKKYIKLSTLKKWIKIINGKRIRDNGIIMELLEIKSSKVYFRYKNKLKERGYFRNDHKFIFPLSLQKMPDQKFHEWLCGAPSLTLHEQHLALGTKKEKVSRILKIYNTKPKRVVFPDKESALEKEFRLELQVRKIGFEPQFPYGKYIIDFKIGDFLIELFGDYWHCNPQIYKEPISTSQKRKLRIDKEKEIFIKHNREFKYAWIWETDFRRNKIEAMADLIKILKGEEYATKFVNR